MKRGLQDLLDILNDKEFYALAREDAMHLLSWDDLTRRALPSGWSARDVWEALFALRRLSGFYIPITNKDDVRKSFYIASREFIEAVVELASQTSTGASLYHQALQRESRRFTYKALVKETHATAQSDGMQVSFEQIEQLLYTNRPPNNAQERIIVNSFDLLTKLDSMINEPFSEKLLRNLYQSVTGGLTPRQLDSELPAMEREGLFGYMLSYPDIYDYANDITKEKWEPDIMTAIMLREAILYFKPFPHLNCTMAWMIFRLYAIKHDYPVIAYLPIVHTTLEWEKGLIPSEVMSYGFSTEEDTTPMNPSHYILGRTPSAAHRFTSMQEVHSECYEDEGDVSRWVVTSLELMLVALRSFQKELTTGLMEIHELSLMDTTLNYRQNSIVLRAKRNPDAEFHIQFHKKANDIAYATARADLLGLVEKGYLKQTVKGRQHVFIPGERIIGHADIT